MHSDGFLHMAGTSGRVVVLLPGFATDHRIFDGLFPEAERIVPVRVGADETATRLAAHLDRSGTGPVTLLGWSLGAFAAADFAALRPASVRRLVLVGARPRYEPAELERFRGALARDRASCLGEFYSQCFLPSQREDYRKFRETLLPAYLREMDPGRLLADLDYLGRSEIRPDRLPAGRAVFVHGARDVIAPAAAARELAARTPGGGFRELAGAAHAAFLADGFAHAAEAP